MDYLFSLHPRHAENIFNGSKTVELRSRRIQIDGPGVIWIYVTTPTKEIAGFAEIINVVCADPKEIWRQYSSQICIGRSEYEDYVGAREEVSAIVIQHAVKFETPLHLKRLRELIPSFHPPQFYIDLSSKQEFIGVLRREFR